MADIQQLIKLIELFNSIEDKEGAIEVLMTQIGTETVGRVGGTKTVMSTAKDYLKRIGDTHTSTRTLGARCGMLCRNENVPYEAMLHGHYYPEHMLDRAYKQVRKV